MSKEKPTLEKIKKVFVDTLPKRPKKSIDQRLEERNVPKHLRPSIKKVLSKKVDAFQGQSKESR